MNLSYYYKYAVLFLIRRISPNVPHSRNPRAVVTPRLCERSLAGDQQLCTILVKKHSLPLVAKDGISPISLTPDLAGVRLFYEVRCLLSYILALTHIPYLFSLYIKVTNRVKYFRVSANLMNCIKI